MLLHLAPSFTHRKHIHSPAPRSDIRQSRENSFHSNHCNSSTHLHTLMAVRPCQASHAGVACLVEFVLRPQKAVKTSSNTRTESFLFATAGPHCAATCGPQPVSIPTCEWRESATAHTEDNPEVCRLRSRDNHLLPPEQRIRGWGR